jgi:hypothetical protein
LPGFTTINSIFGAVVYKNWTPVTLTLSGYQGKQIQLEFTTADCTLGGHFGYAYVDVNANCSTLITGSDYCTGTPAINLQAPAGYQTYNWYNADKSVLLGTGSSIFMAPPPPDGTGIVLDVVPYVGFGCPNTISTVIHAKPAITFKPVDPPAVCLPATVDLTDKAILANSDPALTYTYWQDSLATVTVYNPKAVNTSGTYYIQAASSSCSEIKPVHVLVQTTPAFTINNPAKVCITSTVDLTAKNIKSDTTYTYTYWKDANATISLPKPDQVAAPGNTYYIKGTNKGGCYLIKPVIVSYFPLPTLVTNDPPAVCYPLTVDITTKNITTGSDANLALTYFSDSTAQTAIIHPDTIKQTGTYYIKSINLNGCEIIKPVKVTIYPLPVLNITDPPYVCLLDKVDITASAVTAGSSNIALLNYFTDSLATVTLKTPQAVADSGVYYIKAISPNGCEIIKPVNVAVHNPPVVKITDPKKVYKPNTVDLTDPAIKSGSTPQTTYSYWYNEAATIGIISPKLIDRSATYYIKGTNQYGCYTIKPVEVVVAEIPEIKLPTAFTPTKTSNNKLFPFLIGIKTFTMLRIYNKWGSIVYQTTDPSPEKGWDGSFRGNISSVETFTWVAEGYDYLGNLVHRTGNTVLLK